MSTVASFCRNCGRALNDSEKAAGQISCTSCAEAQFAAQSPPPGAAAGGTTVPMPPVADPGVSPGLAFLLGLIPGVGAIYNGQYAKGLVHVFIFGVLMSIANENHHDPTPLLIMLVMGFYFYMPFEAFHTAQRRQRGLPVDEFSSILPLKGKANGYPVGPLVMILAGVLFLLNNFGLVPMSQILRLWPVALIGLGAVMLRERLRTSSSSSSSQQPPSMPPPPPLYRPFGESPEARHE